MGISTPRMDRMLSSWLLPRWKSFRDRRQSAALESPCSSRLEVTSERAIDFHAGEVVKGYFSGDYGPSRTPTGQRPLIKER